MSKPATYGKPGEPESIVTISVTERDGRVRRIARFSTASPNADALNAYALVATRSFSRRLDTALGRKPAPNWRWA